MSHEVVAAAAGQNSQSADRGLGLDRASIARPVQTGSVRICSLGGSAHVLRVARQAGAATLLVFDHDGITCHPDHQAATDAALEAAPTLDVRVYAWVIPRTGAAALSREFGTTFVGRIPDQADIVLAVDRAAQVYPIVCHRTPTTARPAALPRADGR